MAPKKTGGRGGGKGGRVGGCSRRIAVASTSRIGVTKKKVKNTIVKNIKGTSKKANQISSLKEKYKKATGTNRKYCSVKGKKQKHSRFISNKTICIIIIRLQEGLDRHLTCIETES